jgi:hypothetical protein
MAWGRLSWDIGIKSLDQYRGDNAPNLTCRDARNIHKQIRYAVNLYRLAQGGSQDAGPQTRTKIVNAVERVKINAAGVVRSSCKESWLKRLAAALAVKANLLADLHYALRPQNIDIWSLLSRIDAGNFSKTDLADVKVLAEIEIDKVVPERSRPDPPLERLVRELTPIWSLVTGTSSYPKNDRYGDKVCPFADWLDELIRAARLRPPQENTVARLVRLQKS